MKFSQPLKLITITVIPFVDQEAYTQTFDSVRRKIGFELESDETPGHMSGNLKKKKSDFT